MDTIQIAFGAWHLESAIRTLKELAEQPGGVVIRAVMVIGCYVLWNVAYGMMIVQGYRQKSYGMPTIGSAAVLSTCIVALYGPFSHQSHLFYYKENYLTLSVWIISLVLQAGVYAQCIMYGRDHSHVIPEAGRHFVLICLGLIVVMTITFWNFIVYYQDYYVNEICPIAVLVSSAAFFPTLYARRKDLRGLSVACSWMLAIGDLLLDTSIVFGDITDPFPDASFGYGFIYWIFIL